MVSHPKELFVFFLKVGGRVCDQHITENSQFLKYVVYNDVIMADRGFSIVGTLRAKLEIPSFTKGQDEMRAEDVEDTHVIATVRIHVEQVIGNLRKKLNCIQYLVELYQ